MPPTVASAPVQPADGDERVGAALSHIGGKSPRRIAVIFENYLSQDLTIISRRAPAPCGRRLGMSAKRSMGGHPAEIGSARASYHWKNRRHLMFEMTSDGGLNAFTSF
jgi:hypothetical protein